MRSKGKLSFKRILAIILAVILVIFIFVMLGSFKNAGDTKASMLMVFGFMGTLAIGLLYYGIMGGKEPEVGFIPKKDTDSGDQEKSDKN